MFFRKDQTEVEINRVFGKSIANSYKKSRTGDLYIKVGLLTALKMTKTYPISTPFLQPLIKDELENLMNSEDAKSSNVLLALVGAGASAYARWNLSDTPIPTRLRRLKHVPPGWRMDALSGSRFWMASLIGKPAPVRAWLVEIYASAAALGWDAAVKFETSYGAPIASLPFALQALAINGFCYGLIDEARQLPSSLELAIPIALEGYAEGLPQNLWQRIIDDSSGSILPQYYDALAKYWNEDGNPVLDELGAKCGVELMMEANSTLAALIITSTDFGRRYAHAIDEKWEIALLENEPLLFSGIF